MCESTSLVDASGFISKICKKYSHMISKVFKFSILLFALSVLSSYLVGATPVKVTIYSGIDNDHIRVKIENKASDLLTEINAAYSDNRELRLNKLGVSEFVAESLAMLWENGHFKCADDNIAELGITTGSGYQIRNIPLILSSNSNSSSTDSEYQEAVISFDNNGELSSFYFTISQNLYMSVVRAGREVTDLRHRQLILDYVERFRTSYNQKDIHFLEQIFSEDALIITGKVIQSKKVDGIRVPDKITYKKQSKQEYIANLKRIFANNSYIKVTFDEIEVKRHPANIHFYGVTLHQGYTSSSYHDDGYLFLLWDFTDEDHPLIHVRTWQPDKISGSKLPKEDVFCLDDFDIM